MVTRTLLGAYRSRLQWVFGFVSILFCGVNIAYGEVEMADKLPDNPGEAVSIGALTDAVDRAGDCINSTNEYRNSSLDVEVNRIMRIEGEHSSAETFGESRPTKISECWSFFAITVASKDLVFSGVVTIIIPRDVFLDFVGKGRRIDKYLTVYE